MNGSRFSTWIPTVALVAVAGSCADGDSYVRPCRDGEAPDQTNPCITFGEFNQAAPFEAEAAALSGGQHAPPASDPAEGVEGGCARACEGACSSTCLTLCAACPDAALARCASGASPEVGELEGFNQGNGEEGEGLTCEVRALVCAAQYACALDAEGAGIDVEFDEVEAQ